MLKIPWFLYTFCVVLDFINTQRKKLGSKVKQLLIYARALFFSLCLIPCTVHPKQAEPPYHLLLIHLKRTRGNSDCRNIYSNPSAALVFGSGPRALANMQTANVLACLWKQMIKDFHVSGKSITIACLSHTFCALHCSQWGLNRHRLHVRFCVATLLHGNLYFHSF